jgi:hypothetical protein
VWFIPRYHLYGNRPSFNAMSSSAKRSPKSSTQHGSSRVSAGKSGSKSNVPSGGEWSNWVWNIGLNQECRSRLAPDGKSGPFYDSRMRYPTRSSDGGEHKD